MPTVKRDTTASLSLPCDDPSDTFVVRYDNMGEPYREGLEIGVSNVEFGKSVTVMLCDREVLQLRDLLLKHYPTE